MSQEEKDLILINKNREVLERQIEVMESQRVNVTEDSFMSDMLPHYKPPRVLQSLDGGVTPVKQTVVEYYVNYPKLFK
jgi:hypothetical protein